MQHCIAPLTWGSWMNASGMWAWWKCGGLCWERGRKGIFWKLEMCDVHVQLQRRRITVINSYFAHHGQMLIWQEGTIFSVNLEIKPTIFSKCLCYLSIQAETSDHLFWKMLFSDRGDNILFHALEHLVLNQLDFGLSHGNESRRFPPWMDFLTNFSYPSLTQCKIMVHRSVQCYLCYWTLWEQFQKTSGLCAWRLKSLLVPTKRDMILK